MNNILKHQKLTMQKLAEFKDKKVWDSFYIKCHLCGEFKPAKDGVLVESDMDVEVDYDIDSASTFFKQVYEVVCDDCLKLMEGK